MNRIVNFGYSSLIEAAISYLPLRLQQWAQTIHFLTGTDPIFAGLHSYENTKNGWSYRVLSHCVFPHHQLALPRDQRQTTIVLPTRANQLHIATVIHELGHALHATLDEEITLEATTNYALTNRLEAFADAFMAWYAPPIDPWRDWMNTFAPRATQLFRELA